MRGKAATLHELAGLLADQGDIAKAFDFYNRSLDIYEQLGDVRGKSATLANMAYWAEKQGDTQEARKLYLTAASSLASILAWPDLRTILSNLGSMPGPQNICYLSQALWLSLHTYVPVDATTYLAKDLIEELSAGHDISPFIATTAYYLTKTRGENHPEAEELQQTCINMLFKCAVAREIPEHEFNDWFTKENLNVPDYFLPALNRALEKIIGDNWLFDRKHLAEPVN